MRVFHSLKASSILEPEAKDRRLKATLYYKDRPPNDISDNR